MTLRRAAAAASAGALALGVLAACSGTPGLSDQAVVVATIAPETGADAPGWSEVAVGAAAYFKFLNAHGGVNGRTITYRVTDSTSDPAKTAALWKQLADDNDVYAVLAPPGVDPAEALPADVVDSDIPVVGAPGCPCWSDADDVVGFAPDWRTEGRVLGAYIAAHDKGAKVGYFLEQGAYGEAGAAGLDEELPSSSVVARTTYDPTNTDVRAQIAKLQQAGADVVVAFARPAFSALLRLGFVASDYSPTLVVSNAGGDPATQVTILNGLGKQAQTQVNGLQLVQGMVTDTFVPPPTDLKSSWSKLFQQVHDAYIPQLPFDEHVMNVV